MSSVSVASNGTHHLQRISSLQSTGRFPDLSGSPCLGVRRRSMKTSITLSPVAFWLGGHRQCCYFHLCFGGSIRDDKSCRGGVHERQFRFDAAYSFCRSPLGSHTRPHSAVSMAYCCAMVCAG